MFEIYELKKFNVKLNSKFEKLIQKLDLDSLNEKLGELTLKVNSPDFWNNQKTATEITKQKQALDNLLKTTNHTKNLLDEFQLCLEMYDLEELDLKELNLEYEKLVMDFKSFEVDVLLTGEYDEKSAIIEIHPGAGGTESQDWANMLYDMYTRYFKKNKFKVKVLDYQSAEVAGIKSVTIEVTGEKTYGMLKGENGVHRLVRISPFDSAAKRHTSFASVSVSPVIESNLELNISDSELKIDVYRSSGAGGQSVNTTDSAVRITHLPTNTVVTCQNERSQIQNKEHAMKILMSKLLELKLQEQEQEKAKIAGVQLSNGWGSQKRSYVLHPYKMVKDHHVNFESSQTEKVLNGELEEFLYHNLLKD